MKRLFVSIIILLCIAFAACKKASGPADGNSVQPNNNLDSTVSVSAVINGAQWQTDSAFGDIVKPSGNDSTLVGLMITATRIINDSGSAVANSSSTIVFNITNYTGPNTYTINPPINTATYYVGTNRHFASSGKFIVTADTAYSLKGTFSFVAGTDTVTNGVFNVAMP